MFFILSKVDLSDFATYINNKIKKTKNPINDTNGYILTPLIDFK